jgi:hypothetical protein
MTRTALQAAMREKRAEGKTLHDEINNLADKHVLPESLREWARAIKNAGNLVAHPKHNEQVDEYDAEELLVLAQSIFDYLYAIPALVEARKQRLKETALTDN